MQKLYTPLKTALWSFIGVFLGAALFRYGDWRAHPGLYVSTPWYAGLLPLGALLDVLHAHVGNPLLAGDVGDRDVRHRRR